MNRVTYVLGAGFSAPLGLPVMSNFVIKSKDLYFQNTEKHKHFKSVFNMIQELSIAKNYYETNLFNIEEILSILEMSAFLEGKRLKNDFIKYIFDTIKHYTPEFKGYGGKLSGNWHDFVFGKRGPANGYGYFVGSIFNLKIEKKDLGGERQLWVKDSDIRPANYSILSLNYDLVLENVCNFINDNYNKESTYKFNKSNAPDWITPSLFKLHGSMDEDVIVPPTWAKGTHRKVIPTWRNAYQTLLNSTHIRFIGYSLPMADSYIKYLLKSSVVNSQHLKQIDVICLDNNGSVKQRYNDFINFDYYRFKNANVTEYFSKIKEKSEVNRNFSADSPVTFAKLEDVHEEFMYS